MYSHYTRDDNDNHDDVMCSLLGKIQVNWRCRSTWDTISPPYDRDI